MILQANWRCSGKLFSHHFFSIVIPHAIMCRDWCYPNQKYSCCTVLSFYRQKSIKYTYFVNINGMRCPNVKIQKKALCQCKGRIFFPSHIDQVSTRNPYGKPKKEIRNQRKIQTKQNKFFDDLSQNNFFNSSDKQRT